MKVHRNWFTFAAVALIAGLLSSCGIRRKAYDNPITKDTQQPDKVLFDRAINDIEHGRYEIARLTLNTLMNTYDQSEFLAKAKLAIADSWYREGGAHGLAQAEAEYKDFILFYPTMEEAAEAQEKVCTIQYKQMEKADRDPSHAVRAEEECRQVITQFPNSKFAIDAQQRLRDIQEVLAEGEYRVGSFYYTKGIPVAAINRLEGVTNHFPLYSKADEALWKLGDSYEKLGPRFRDRSADAYSRIIRDYPLSAYADAAKKKLTAMERPIPEPDPVALARQKYELEHHEKPGMMSHFWGIFRGSPDTTMAAKSGTPAMDSLHPSVPLTVPSALAAAVNADVSAKTISGTSALDTQPDARQRPAQDANAASQQQSSDQQQAAKTDNKKKTKKNNEPDPSGGR
jgi:outer membrane protein assembly factor BamD